MAVVLGSTGSARVLHRRCCRHALPPLVLHVLLLLLHFVVVVGYDVVNGIAHVFGVRDGRELVPTFHHHGVQPEFCRGDVVDVVVGTVD